MANDRWGCLGGVVYLANRRHGCAATCVARSIGDFNWRRWVSHRQVSQKDLWRGRAQKLIEDIKMEWGTKL